MRLDLRTKLLGSSLIVVALMVGLGIFALVQMSTIQDEMILTSTNIVPSVKIQGEILQLLHSYRGLQYQHILTTTDDEMSQIEFQLASNDARIQELFDLHQPLILNAEDQGFLDRSRANWQNYLEQSSEVLSLSRQQDTDEASLLLLSGNVERSFEALRNEVESWIRFNDLLTEQGLAEANNSYITGQRLVIMTLIGVTIIGLAISFFLARSIAGTVNIIARASTAIAQGDIEQHISIKSSDELGQMADAFAEMITYLKEMAHAADRLAQGDLTVEVTPRSQNDVLGNAFAGMTVNLRTLIGQVQQSSAQMAIASQQIAQSIQQVAEGTGQQTVALTGATRNVEQVAQAAEGIARGAQEQASAMQKTSILVGEVTSMVIQVGEIARAVSGANHKVTQVAQQGAQAVGQSSEGMTQIQLRTTQAMQKVKEMGLRSAEIGRIVEVIDDIADKTDMLALNAAVEAARAGEHGRGFAVVADQVRRLSEDAKSATRDIGELIQRVHETVREVVTAMEASTEEVHSGARLAGDTSSSLEEILAVVGQAATLAEEIGGAVEQVRKRSEGLFAAIETVSAVVEENTASSEEMAASSREVSEGMEAVAGVAEENSAAVEEVSASAEELADLAEELRSATAQFRMDDEGGEEPWGPRAPRHGRVYSGYGGNGRKSTSNGHQPLVHARRPF